MPPDANQPQPRSSPSGGVVESLLRLTTATSAPQGGGSEGVQLQFAAVPGDPVPLLSTPPIGRTDLLSESRRLPIAQRVPAAVMHPETRVAPDEGSMVPPATVHKWNLAANTPSAPVGEIDTALRVQTNSHAVAIDICSPAKGHRLAVPKTIPAHVAPGGGKAGALRALDIHSAATQRAGADVLSNMHLTRRRARSISEVEFSRERAILAAAAGVDVSNIAWIGLFRNVPLAAARSVDIDERYGILSMALKPDASALLRSARTPVATLAVGRNMLTGALVQSLIS